MPNTTHGNGISRKIADAKERQRLKKIIETFAVPPGMGCIIRTAGMGRTKPEVKRDIDYLFKTWEEIREATLKSVAPKLIFEEGNLIKRSLRDLYDKHIDEVLVEGEEGFELAKNFMKRLIPSHAKKVKKYEEKTPLFHKFGVEDKIDSLFSSTLTLPSGGYIVINPTEALVAIDVNSGKATKEHNIEETALQTNIEAAEEIARQLRLRDIAGLIVIDFIDMEDMRNVKAIERKFRDALKNDRARIFTNRISALGLLEMSRQRLRSSLYEISTQPCPHCEASGRLPSIGTLALRVLRNVEEYAIGAKASHIVVHAPQELALYLLNAKRHILDEIENQFNVKVLVNPTMRIRMPHFDVRGMSEDQIEREMQNDNSLFAPGLFENMGGGNEAPKPAGFGKSDGRGSFPGKNRRRGRRGGTRQRHGRGQRPQHGQQHGQQQGSRPKTQARPNLQAQTSTEGKLPIRDDKTARPAKHKPVAQASVKKTPTTKPLVTKPPVIKPVANAATKPATTQFAKPKTSAVETTKKPVKKAPAKTVAKPASAKPKAASKPAPAKKAEAKAPVQKPAEKKTSRKGWWKKAVGK